MQPAWTMILGNCVEYCREIHVDSTYCTGMISLFCKTCFSLMIHEKSYGNISVKTELPFSEKGDTTAAHVQQRRSFKILFKQDDMLMDQQYWMGWTNLTIGEFYEWIRILNRILDIFRRQRLFMKADPPQYDSFNKLGLCIISFLVESSFRFIYE